MPAPWSTRASRLVDSPAFERFILGVILANAVRPRRRDVRVGRARVRRPARHAQRPSSSASSSSSSSSASRRPASRRAGTSPNGWNVFDFIVVGGAFVPGAARQRDAAARPAAAADRARRAAAARPARPRRRRRPRRCPASAQPRAADASCCSSSTGWSAGCSSTTSCPTSSATSATRCSRCSSCSRSRTCPTCSSRAARSRSGRSSTSSRSRCSRRSCSSTSSSGSSSTRSTRRGRSSSSGRSARGAGRRARDAHHRAHRAAQDREALRELRPDAARPAGARARLDRPSVTAKPLRGGLGEDALDRRALLGARAGAEAAHDAERLAGALVDERAARVAPVDRAVDRVESTRRRRRSSAVRPSCVGFVVS